MATSPDYWTLLASLKIPWTYKVNRSGWRLESHGSHTVNGVQLIPGAPGFDPKAAYLMWSSLLRVTVVAPTPLTLTGTNGNDTLTGGTENDTFTGGAGADSLIGGGGNDTFNVTDTASDGSDTIDGGAGTGDTIAVAANQVIVFAANDAVITGVENITLGAAAGVTLTGQLEAFNITASTGNETVVGGDGNDTITGGAGADSINAGAGTNTVTDAGQGADTITHNVAGSTVAIAVTGTGTVTLTASQSGATATSAAGVNTTINASTSTAAVTVNGDTGNDTITGGAGNDTITGGAGADSINAGAGTNTVTDAGQGADTITHNAAASTVAVAVTGTGTVTLTASQSGATATSAAGVNTTVNASTSTAAVTLNGNTGNDALTGGSGADTLAAGAGNDTIAGGGGADSITGGGGADTIDVGNGDAAVDTVVLAAAADSFVGAITSGITNLSATIDVVSNLAVGDRLNLTGLSLNASIHGAAVTSSLNDVSTAGSWGLIRGTYVGGVFTQNSGTDTHTLLVYDTDGVAGGSLGAMVLGGLFGGSAVNGLVTLAHPGNALTGTPGNDTLIGAAGDDTIQGLAGADSLVGGAGADSMIGGAGADIIDVGLDLDRDVVVLTATSDSYVGTITNASTNLSASIDVVSNLGSGDILDLTGLGFNSRINGAPNSPSILTNVGSRFVWIHGTYVGGVFTQNTGANTHTLLAYDMDGVVATLDRGALVMVGLLGGNAVNGIITLGAILNSTVANDGLIGGAGNDTFNVTSTANDGGDTIDGGAGTTDTIVVASGQTIVFAVDDNIRNIERITLGTAAGVTLTGQTEAFFITGSSGNDVVVGGSGHDSINAGVGNDTLTGGLGNDSINVGSGTDLVTDAGIGNDTVTGGDPSATVTVEVIGPGAVEISVSAGTVAVNIAAGIDGRVSGVIGGFAALTINGNTGNDSLVGFNANDVFNGGSGNDTLNGGGGHDTLMGGPGNDVLTGETGNDVFVYTTSTHSNANTSIDRITDLVLNGSSADRLDFTLTGTLSVRTATVAANLTDADTQGEIHSLFRPGGSESAGEQFTGGSNATAVLATFNNGMLLVVDVNGDGTFNDSDVVINVTGVTVTNFTTACFM